MKRYTFVADALSVHGSQTYFVDAASEEDARKLVEKGQGEFLYEELEVQDLGPFQLCDVEDIPA
jgi:hypothetical protein